MKAIFVLDESVRWQSCAKDKSESGFPIPPSKVSFFTFQGAFVALWMMPVTCTEALILVKEIDSAQTLLCLVYGCDICSEIISVSKLVHIHQSYFILPWRWLITFTFFSSCYRLHVVACPNKIRKTRVFFPNNSLDCAFVSWISLISFLKCYKPYCHVHFLNAKIW